MAKIPTMKENDTILEYLKPFVSTNPASPVHHEIQPCPLRAGSPPSCYAANGKVIIRAEVDIEKPQPDHPYLNFWPLYDGLAQN